MLEKRLLPLRPAVQAKTLLIATRSLEEGKEIEDMGTHITGKAAYFLRSSLRYKPETDLLVIDENPTEQDRRRVLEPLASGSYKHVLYAAFVRVISYK